MNGSGITYEDVILAQSREEEEKLRKKLETYKNVIKEAIDKLNNWDEEKSEAIDDYYLKEDFLKILNKVGDDNE